MIFLFLTREFEEIEKQIAEQNAKQTTERLLAENEEVHKVLHYHRVA